MDDLISRRKAIDTTWFDPYYTDPLNVLTEVRDRLEVLPSAQAEPKWIPVTERLPEKPEGYPKCEIRRTYYLVSLKSGCVKALGYEFDRDEWQITGSPVVAWMPLPEPFTGVEE